MASIVITDLALQEALIGLLSRGGQQLNVRLYVNNVLPDRANSSPAQFTEATYPGYAPSPWVYTPVTVDASHRGQLAAATPVFSPPSSGADVSVYGWFVTYLGLQDALAHVLVASPFTSPPRVLTVGGPALSLNISFSDFDAS
jgi:hypothetical protein